MTWRSWFWNIVLTFLLTVMAGIGTWVAFTTQPLAANIVYGAIAAALWAGVIRSLMLGVRARPDAVVMRGLMRTYTIPWGEVASISGDAPAGGPSGSLGATAPVIHRKGKKSVELNVLGGYGWSRVRPTPAEKAIAELNRRLELWHAENP